MDSNKSDTDCSADAAAAEKKRQATRVYVRDRLLLVEVPELADALPPTCKIDFDDPDKLWEFNVTITPDEGHWKGGKFVFRVLVPDGYNFVPPTVKCDTRIWHPNINEEGAVCLSLLRQASFEDVGWAPTRHLKDVVWGLNSLFADLVNFDDPLNIEAAEMYKQDPVAFQRKVTAYMKSHCKP